MSKQYKRAQLVADQLVDDLYTSPKKMYQVTALDLLDALATHGFVLKRADDAASAYYAAARGDDS